MAITIIILAICAIVIFSLSWVEISFTIKNGEENKVSVFIKYLFIKKDINPKKKKKNNIEKKKKEEKTFEDYKAKIEEYLHIFEELKEDIIKILRFANDRLIIFKNIDFSFKFGFDDPMATGVLNGIIYAGVYNILGVIHNNMTIENLEVDIVPDFDNVCHDVLFNCILKLKNVHIIVMIIKLVKLYGKFKNIKKRGSNNYGRTSNSRAYGISNGQH